MDWMGHYVDWFIEEPIECLDPEDGQEYALIGQILLRGTGEKRLLDKWFCSLCNGIHKGPYGVMNIVSALDVALLSVDKGVFNGNAEPLLRLANDLLSALDPGQTVFTEGTYSTHSATMSALHQTFVAIQETSPDLLDPSLKGGVYQNFKTHLQEIARSQRFYRFKFLVNLIEQSLQRLELKEKLTVLTLGCSRLFQGMTGVLCILDGIRGFAEIEFKLDAFEAGHRNLQKALTSQRIKRKPWYEWIQALNSAALLVAQEPERFVMFETCYDSLKQKQRRMKKSEDRWIIRCGMIDQLVSLTLHAPNDRVRTPTFKKLLDLGKKKKSGGWASDTTILEPLLDAFCSVYNAVMQNEKDAMEDAVKRLKPFKKAALRKIFIDWCRGQTVRERLASKNSPTVEETGRVFHFVKKKIGPPGVHGDSQEHRDVLKAIYQAPAFAKVPSLFDNEEPRHVASFKYSLVHYEEVTASPGEAQKEDQSASNSDHKNMESTPILLDELFKERSVVPGGRVEAIRKVLVVGNPGTGKTSLAKKLAYHWAVGEWGTEHEALYVIQVRELSESFYDGANIRKAPTVASSILNALFPWQADAEYSALRQCINAELEKETTLLIVDGLDEQAGASKRILEEAKHCPCKLLMLSRPYGLQEECDLVDLEVECLGLSDVQLIKFVRNELPEECSSELVPFLKTNPSVWTVAHVPVIANIVCFLWKEKSKDLLVSDTNDSPFKLYKCMVQHIWKRHVEKDKFEDLDWEDVFDALGKIAFDALKEGQILISQTVVGRHSRKCSLGRALKTSGFLLLQLKGILYHFAHFTFQEFFAGGHMVKKLYHGSCQEVEDAESFIAQNKYNPRYRQMLSFMAEEIRSIAGFEGLDRLMKTINRKPRDIAGVQHFILCLTVLEAFSSVAFDQVELHDLLNSEAMGVVQMATSLWMISPSGSNLERLMLKALEDAPKTVGNFGHLADTLLDKNFGLRLHDAFNKKAKYKKILKLAANPRPRIVNGAAISKTTDDDLICALISEHTAPTRTPRAVIEEVDARYEHMPDGLKTCDDHIGTRVMRQNNRVTGFQDESAGVGRAVTEKIPAVIESQPRLAVKVDDKIIKECGDQSPFVRMAAIEKIPAAIKSRPWQSVLLTDAFIRMCEDESPGIRKAAVEKIPAVIESRPQLSAMLTDTLISSFGDESVDVRRAAVKKIPAVIQHRPQLPAMLTDALISSFGDESVDVRRAAIKEIPAVIQYHPQLATKMVEALVMACGDESPDIRKAAIEKIPAVLKFQPRSAALLTDTMITACGDQSPDVRRAAIAKIPATMESQPRRSVTLTTTLLKACKDCSADVRRAAIEKIPAAIESQSQLTAKVTNALFRACEDRSVNIRLVALGKIEALIEFQPLLVAKVSSTMIRACKDRSAIIRKAAIEKIPLAIELQPQLAIKGARALIRACKDRSVYVRRAAIEKIPAVIEFQPDLATNMVDALLRACKDRSVYVRMFAIKTIPSVIESQPCLATRLPSALISVCGDASADVRMFAVEGMPAVIGSQPRLAAKASNVLISSCGDASADVRKAAIENIQAVIESQPHLMDKVAEVLIKACRDKSTHVRTASIQKIPAVLEFQPWLADKVADVLISACGDESADIRRGSVQRIPVVLEFKPQQAAMLTDALIEACEDRSAGVRMTAIKKIPAVIESQPEKAAILIHTLAKACEDQSADVQKAAFEKIPEVIEAQPQQAVILMNALIRACGDVSVDVRLAAVTKIPKLIESQPQQTAMLIDALIRACRDRMPNVKIVAIRIIPEVLEGQPQQADKVADALIRACGDKLIDVRIASHEKIDAMIEFQPQLAAILTDAVIRACGDESVDVRRAAVEKIPALIESRPQLAGRLSDVLISACEDESIDVRRAAIEKIPALIESRPQQAGTWIGACRAGPVKLRRLVVNKISDLVISLPQHACKLVDGLIEASKDEQSDIREIAVGKISDLVEALTKPGDHLVDTLIEGFRDPASNVRQIVIERIPILITSLPERADDLVDALTMACEDESPFLCNLAQLTIKSLLKSIAAHKLTDVISRFLALSTHNRSHVAICAKWGLGQLPIEPVIDCYWHCFDPKLMFFIAPAFFNLAAFTVGIPGEHLPMRLVLHNSPQAVVEWTRNSKEMEIFVGAVIAEINKEHPILLQLTSGTYL